MIDFDSLNRTKIIIYHRSYSLNRIKNTTFTKFLTTQLTYLNHHGITPLLIDGLRSRYGNTKPINSGTMRKITHISPFSFERFHFLIHCLLSNNYLLSHFGIYYPIWYGKLA